MKTYNCHALKACHLLNKQAKSNLMGGMQGKSGTTQPGSGGTTTQEGHPVPKAPTPAPDPDI